MSPVKIRIWQSAINLIVIIAFEVLELRVEKIIIQLEDVLEKININKTKRIKDIDNLKGWNKIRNPKKQDNGIKDLIDNNDYKTIGIFKLIQ